MKDNVTLAVLGSTGSIGRQTLDVAAKKNITVNAIAFGSDISLGEEQIRKFKPKYCAVSSESAGKALKTAVADTDTEIIFGDECVDKMLSLSQSDICINGIGGFDGLLPTLSALKYCGRLGLANKESIVAAGDIVLAEANKKGKTIIPVDSEHSTLFRCMTGENKKDISRLIITCSGGAFYGKSRAELEKVTAEDAVSHPTWKMGKAITVNCATLINKGLEVIEASKLFGIDGEKIDVVIHRESIIHSLVEYSDRSVKALLSYPDMRIPIQYAITYPRCEESETEPLDFIKLGKLTFAGPDREAFPLLSLAEKALKRGGVIPCVMNAANEVAVNLFLSGKIGFCDISDVVISVTENYHNIENPKLDDIIGADKHARTLAAETAEKYIKRR